MRNVGSLQEALSIQKEIYNRGFSCGPFGGVVQNLAYQKRIAFSLKFIKRGFRVLDIGCGDGTVTKGVARKAKKVVGIDVSQQAISVAKEFNPASNIDYLKINIENFWPQDKFDAMLLFETIEHLFEPEKTLRRIRDFLNEKGLLLISTPNYQRLTRRVKSIAGIRHIRRLLGKDEKRIGCDHFQEYTPKELCSLLEEVGFKVIDFEGIILWTNTVGGRFLREVKPIQELNHFLGSLLSTFAGHIYVAAKKA